jgi:hypothetical protein
MQLLNNLTVIKLFYIFSYRKHLNSTNRESLIKFQVQMNFIQNLGDQHLNLV